MTHTARVVAVIWLQGYWGQGTGYAYITDCKQAGRAICKYGTGQAKVDKSV